MATVYLPRFDPEDFEAAKAKLGSDMPDTYEKWRDLILNRSHHIRVSGDEPVTVKIYPDELPVMLLTYGRHGVLNALDMLAATKGEGGHRD